VVLSPTSRTCKRVASLLILLSLLLAACDASGPTTVARPTATSAPPTATPVFAVKPPIHQINLGDFQADAVRPNAHGLLLFGRPAGTDAGPTSQPAVYFYDFASQTIQTLATPTPAPDGTPRGITYRVTAGDWIVYSFGDFSGSAWELWAVNVVTQRKVKLDTFLDEGSVAAEVWRGIAATDGKDVVWSANIATASRPTWVLRTYNFASGATHTLLSGPNAPSTGPHGIANGTILVDESQPSPSPQDGLYLWTLGGAAPQHISPEVTTTGHLNDRYVVWDQPQLRSLTLYDRSAGQIMEQWGPKCIRPDIAPDRPYVACFDFDSGLMQLVQIPTGQAITLGKANQSSAGAIANGRAYWAVPGNSPGGAGNIVDYIDLPAA
jgi:hypothetical protein